MKDLNWFMTVLRLNSQPSEMFQSVPFREFQLTMTPPHLARYHRHRCGVIFLLMSANLLVLSMGAIFVCPYGGSNCGFLVNGISQFANLRDWMWY